MFLWSNIFLAVSAVCCPWSVVCVFLTINGRYWKIGFIQYYFKLKMYFGMKIRWDCGIPKSTHILKDR